MREQVNKGNQAVSGASDGYSSEAGLSPPNIPANVKCPRCGYITSDPFNCVTCKDPLAPFRSLSEFANRFPQQRTEPPL